MRAEGEFERHQLPAGIRRCGGGMEPPGRDPAERREKRGGPGSEEPHESLKRDIYDSKARIL